MRLKVSDWEFEVDIASTMEYSASEAAEHCTCAYCRNFYGAIDGAYPGLRTFLGRFGIDAEAPDELMPFEPTLVSSRYAVCGRILKTGSPLCVGSLPIRFETAEAAEIHASCPTPYFVLAVGPMQLPWVLDERAADTVSTANAPAFIGRMRERLLRYERGSGNIS